jgi:hypothetical protein
MPDAPREPFEREEFLDKPGIIGARWWQHSLKSPPDLLGRRNAMVGILVAGGCLAALGTSIVVAAAASGSNDYRYEPRPALDMQKEYGWSFGATAESLTFDGQSQRPFDRDALAHLADDLRPGRPEHVPWYVPTLFQSPNAMPRSAPKEDTTPPTPLKAALVPVFTPAMNAAYRRGKALAALFKAATSAPRALLVVDLPGPEAVAFAAGAAGVFDPVFALDNWPHPRGVVPAHQALAAAAYYQPLFARHAAPAGALPMIVLDRTRLSAYTDDAAQFDNRHVARVPGAPALSQLGISKVLYVAPKGGDKELDDLNDDFVLYAKAGLDVKLVGADAFAPDPSEAPDPRATPGGEDERPLYYYGGNAPSNGWFWHDYPWIRAGALPPGKGPTAPLRTQAGIAYAPVARATPYSSGAPGLATTRPRPPSFGTVPVVISVATGLILGARLFRSGSWNRASGGWGG